MWRNVRGQYQFGKWRQIWAPPCFLVGIASIEYTKQITTWRALRCYSDVAIVHHSRFCKANRNMVPGSPARTKYVTSPNGRCTNLSYQKTWRPSKSDVTSAILNCYWPRTFLHTFATKLSIVRSSNGAYSVGYLYHLVPLSLRPLAVLKLKPISMSNIQSINSWVYALTALLKNRVFHYSPLVC